MKVVLAGGSGTLGRSLAPALAAAGHDPVVLTRTPRADGATRQVPWDGHSLGDWVRELEGAAVVNLAGELVDRRPTPAGIRLLTDSRVEPTRALVAASGAVTATPPVWLQLSTLAIYGDAGDAVLDESAPLADGPPQMAGVARAWEDATQGASAGRLATLRTALVLDRGTPALDRLTGLARWGLGGRVSSGQQWISWLHVQDFVAATLWLLDRSTLEGVVHVTSPEPLTNAEMMTHLRHAMHRPPAPPTPAFAVRLGARLLRSDPALALTGRRCVPSRLIADGFTFQHRDFAEALDDLLSTGSPVQGGLAG
ncbi:MAG: epimerase [Actinomycetes bacterium]